MKISCLLVSCLLLLSAPAAADVRLPHIFGDKMVLQRRGPVPVWGSADPGEEVIVEIGTKKAAGRADTKGRWMVVLPAMEAGGPFVMTVRGNNTLCYKNVLLGEVWLCSGQCNMEWPVYLSKNAETEIPAACHPEIRLFHVPQKISNRPLCDTEASWQTCKPAAVQTFSAVAYFFGLKLHQELKVPVGLIQASKALTKIEPWIPLAGFRSVPGLRHIVNKMERDASGYRKSVGDALDPLEAWIEAARAALEAGESPPPLPTCPDPPLNSHHDPTTLYNGMVHAVAPFALRGAIWFQGEKNIGNGMRYLDKMKALIQGWRKVWRRGNFPFYFVQLNPYRYGGRRPTEKAAGNPNPYHLPELWEAQTASLALPNTGMAVTTDLGTPENYQPRDKREVGRRLALWALAKTYGFDDLVYSGPLFRSMTAEGVKIRVRFDHTGSGLTTRDGEPPDWFEIAGANGKYLEARAEIEGDTVILWSEAIEKPVSIRFGWHCEAQPNMINEEGLPASPFRASL